MRSSPVREEEGGGVSPRQPVSGRKRRSTGKAATYAGRTYRSYKELVLKLMTLTGRSSGMLLNILRYCDGDGDAAVRWCQTHRRRLSSHSRAALKIQFEGREMSRYAIARELAPRLPGVSATAIRDQLRLNGDDVAALMRTRESAQITVADITYPNRAAFCDMLHQRYRVSPRTLQQWLRQGCTPDEVMTRAKGLAQRRRGRRRRQPKQQRDIVLLGWRFSSFSALCAYYGISVPAGRRDAFEAHLLAGKTGCWFPPIAQRLARLWEAGRLDERNRWDQRTEARKPPRSLPRNSERLPVTEPMELAMLKLQTTTQEKLAAWSSIVAHRAVSR